MTNRFTITKETFECLSPDAKLNALFDLALSSCEDIQNLKKWNLSFAAVWGLIGGIIAHLGESLIKK